MTLTLDHLRKSYDERLVVDDVCLEIEDGEIFGLLGPNGAGKTTTMSIVAGLVNADAGEVRLGGDVLNTRDPERRRVLGVVPQDLAIYPDLSGLENLCFFGSMHGFSRAELRQRVDRTLEQVGLTEHARRLAGTYSGGMKRRLNFAAAILHDPQLLILDEPTVGVDPQSRSHLLDVVRHLGSGNTIVIYASHYMEEVEAVCRRAAIMDHGRIIVCGEISNLLEQVDEAMTVDVGTWNDAVARRLQDSVTVTATKTGTHLKIRPGGASGLTDPGCELARVLSILAEERIPIGRVDTHEASLERLFLELTGRTLRDG
jgi:ABC-2 type transport system ATP-binding protein